MAGYVGKELVLVGEAPEQPFVSLPADVLDHRHDGLGTTLVRQPLVEASLLVHTAMVRALAAPSPVILSCAPPAAGTH